LLDELYQARRNGQNPVLIVAGTDASEDAIHRRAKILEIPLHNISSERDLRIWMQGSRKS